MPTRELYLHCPVPVEDGTMCGGELVVEWEEVIEAIPTGDKICRVCDLLLSGPHTEDCLSFEDEIGKHEWVEEWEEKHSIDLVSYKTYCWHLLSKEQVLEIWGEMVQVEK